MIAIDTGSALDAQLDAHRATQTTLQLWGPPGTGKSSVIRAYAEKHDLHLEVVLLAQLEPSEVGGLPFLDKNGTTKTQYALPAWFHNLLDQPNGAVLFFDELNAAPWSVQAAALTFIQDRMLRGVKLPDNVLVVAAGNPVGTGISALPLNPPMANRLSHFTFTPPLDMYLPGFRKAWGREIGGVEMMLRAVVAAFLSSHRDLLHAMPTTDEDQGGPWPSHRSWDEAVRIMSVLVDPAAQMNALGARVGQAAAAQYAVFSDGFRLPEHPSEIFTGTIKWADKDSGYIAAVLAMMLNYVEEQKDANLYKMAGDILLEISEIDGSFDVAAFNASDYVLLKSKVPKAEHHKKVISTFQKIIKDSLGK